MPMTYNPGSYDESNDHGGSKWTPTPGEYPFRVVSAEETLSKAGLPMCKCKLAVQAGGKFESTSWANLSYSPKASWRLKQFFDCVGLDFFRPPEVHELVGKTGTAVFLVNNRGYLDADEYIPGSANNSVSSRPSQGGQHNYGPPPMTDDDRMPF